MLSALSDFPDYQYADPCHDFDVKDASRPHRPAQAVLCYSTGTLYKVIMVSGTAADALAVCRGLGTVKARMKGQAFTTWIETHFPLEVCHTTRREIDRAFAPFQSVKG